jgi:hypothetical protein
MQHPQEQVLRPADRAPMNPRDLRGPALDLAVMRGRRQRPVKCLPHGHMIGTAHHASPLSRGLAAPLSTTVTYGRQDRQVRLPDRLMIRSLQARGHQVYKQMLSYPFALRTAIGPAAMAR